MARNRIIYQSEALYAGPSPATGFHLTSGNNIPWVGPTGNSLVKQLQRIQTANYSFTVDRTDVNQFGQLAAIDRVILTNPTVSLDFSYILANLANENNLGFTITTATGGNGVEVSAISGLLNGTQDERNYFIRTVPEGNDAVGFTSTTSGNNGVIGIGNGFISSYSTEGSVGNFPTTTINVEGLNMNFQQGTSGNIIPAVNPADGSSLTNYYQLATATQNMGTSSSASGISALRPGDVTVTIPQSNVGGADVTTMNVQSYTLSFDLSRTPIEKLGNKFAFSRPIDFPLSVNLSVEAQITDLITGDLSVLVCDDSATYSPTITIKTPGCAPDKDVVAQYKLKGAKLDSQEYSSDIGSNKTVTLTFSTQVGGPQDTSNGLFISGLV